MSEDFFTEEQKECSKIKTNIVTKYFGAYVWVLKKIATNGLNYIDLFCGPGKYENGEESTPIKVINSILQDDWMSQNFHVFFNDMKKDNINSLEKHVKSLEGIERLQFDIEYINDEVDLSTAEIFNKLKLRPSLVFLDPCGYIGISTDLIAAFLKDFACDVIFFFNFNRINMGITNPFAQDNLEIVFGKDEFHEIQSKIRDLRKTKANQEEIEKTLLKVMFHAINRKLGKQCYFPRFRFKFEHGLGNRTSHHIVLCTKDAIANKIMSDIMNKVSSEVVEDLGSFEYKPKVEKDLFAMQSYDMEIKELKQKLLKVFIGQEMLVEDIYSNYSVSSQVPYPIKFYKEVLKQMEDKGLVTINPSKENRRKNTLADDCVVKFPVKESENNGV
ncbi:MAG: three-Cys-motif partner protein TcmP [Planctomycetes bacterium]|nr:three-Cys-motif partner protein TcmP [Planctomycetota bacterium]